MREPTSLAVIADQASERTRRWQDVIPFLPDMVLPDPADLTNALLARGASPHERVHEEAAAITLAYRARYPENPVIGARLRRVLEEGS